ncbi:MAG: hypothetical protein V3U35_09415 [Candidatus Neomarinimicrobiota bacterium]
MPHQLPAAPFRVPATGGKLIEEFFGAASSGHDGFRPAQMDMENFPRLCYVEFQQVGASDPGDIITSSPWISPVGKIKLGIATGAISDFNGPGCFFINDS